MIPDYDYSAEDLVSALSTAGITKGNTIFVHSNIGFFGKMKDVKSRNELCQSVIDALISVVGTEGTVLLPAFSYSFFKGEVFNPKTTKSDCGMLSQYAVENENFVRSLDANFSIVAYGRLSKEYTDIFSHESFGRDSFWTRLLEEDGLIVFLNTDCSTTFIHYIEKCNSVAYRYNKAFNGEYIDRDGTKKRDYLVHFVCDLDKYEDNYTGKGLYDLCEREHLLNTVDVGRGNISVTTCSRFYNAISNELARHPRFLTNGGNNK